jgi:hypothetical protein
MARISQPWFRADRNAYFVTIDALATISVPTRKPPTVAFMNSWDKAVGPPITDASSIR